MELYQTKLKNVLKEICIRKSDEKAILICESFLKSISKKKERPNRISLIKLIIELTIKDIKDAKNILESCDYPYDYTKPFEDLYDEALRLFIKNDIYTGDLQNIYQYENEKVYISDNQEKFENVLKNIIYSCYFNNIEIDDCNNLAYNLHLKLDRLQDSKSNIYDLLYPKCPEMTKLRKFIGEYENNFSTEPISAEEFINVILLTFFDNFYEKKKKQFRRVLDDIQQSIYKKVFMDQIYLNRPFSFERFNSFYDYIFLRGELDKRNIIFLNLFNKIIKNIRDIDFNISYSIQKLTDEEINERLIVLKTQIDAKRKG